MTAPNQKSRATQKQPKPYHWFKGASVRALYDQLTAAGPDSARLEVRVDGDKMYLRVIADGEGSEVGTAAPADINDSFLCPPYCK